MYRNRQHLRVSKMLKNDKSIVSFNLLVKCIHIDVYLSFFPKVCVIYWKRMPSN